MISKSINDRDDHLAQRSSCVAQELSGAFGNDADEGDDVDVCEGAGIAPVILDELTDARRPDAGAPRRPALWRQDDAAPWPPELGLREFDDLRFDAVRGRGLCPVRPRSPYARSTSPPVATAGWTLEPCSRLASSQPARSPLPGVERRVRRSRMAALGFGRGRRPGAKVSPDRARVARSAGGHCVKRSCPFIEIPTVAGP